MRLHRVSAVTAAAALALAAGAGPALAHTGLPGHEHAGFWAGLMHPVSGMDHLLAMLSVGIWSALATDGDRRRVWLAPFAFVSAMLVGAMAGYGGVPLPLVETGIAASVVALGLMIAARVQLPVLVGSALVAVFAIYHGHAHGSEAVGSIVGYMAGFALTTATLHVAGIAAGLGLMRLRLVSGLLGAGIAAAGVYLLAS